MHKDTITLTKTQTDQYFFLGRNILKFEDPGKPMSWLADGKEIMKHILIHVSFHTLLLSRISILFRNTLFKIVFKYVLKQNNNNWVALGVSVG